MPNLRNARREKRLRRLYGIDSRQYGAMIRRQRGKCALCLRAPKPGRVLNVDHDHKTGRVRGGLCYYCNHRFLGRGREDALMHARATTYLLSAFDGRTL